MCEVTTWVAVAGLVLSAAAGVQQHKAQKATAQYQADVAEKDAEISAIQAQNALAAGAKEEDRQRARVRQMLGKQRTLFAANNVVGNTGSAVAIMEETAALGEEDALTIRANAARQAWGFNVQEVNALDTGQMALATGANAARGTLLSTGATLAGQAAAINWSTKPNATAANSAPVKTRKIGPY